MSALEEVVKQVAHGARLQRHTTKYTRRVVLNISGEIYETYYKTLSRFPNTLLGNKKKLELRYCRQTRQYFFNRNRSSFPAILFYYQSNGTLSCPSDVPITLFEEECNYFEIPSDVIEKMKLKKGILPKDDVTRCEDLPFRLHVWNILDNPRYSPAALVFGSFSITIVWISIIALVMETTPLFTPQSTKRYWLLVEFCLNVWFLIEVLLRMIFSINILEFMKGPLNIIDLTAVIPYFLLLLIQRKISPLSGTSNIFKFLRILRVFRLTSHSRKCRQVVKIIRHISGTFKDLFLVQSVLIFIGGSVIYVIENMNNLQQSDFVSIPASLWYSVQTVTSVGYGDLVPVTVPGKVFSGFFMSIGILVSVVTILNVVAEFTSMYKLT